MNATIMIRSYVVGVKCSDSTDRHCAGLDIIITGEKIICILPGDVVVAKDTRGMPYCQSLLRYAG
jgi:hypothetical protein